MGGPPTSRPAAGATGSSRAFALVLCGGGARGCVHVGVLRALEHLDLRPAAVVGVSTGAVVAAAYALRHDWYRALLEMQLAMSPRVVSRAGRPRTAGLRRAWS
ncbi:MAG: hypothetical protein FJ207_02950 [Gemmatimonadetes bacterium]|nr:hypothetical protein [Gemmatimonadota bacterium]